MAELAPEQAPRILLEVREYESRIGHRITALREILLGQFLVIGALSGSMAMILASEGAAASWMLGVFTLAGAVLLAATLIARRMYANLAPNATGARWGSKAWIRLVLAFSAFLVPLAGSQLFVFAEKVGITAVVLFTMGAAYLWYVLVVDYLAPNRRSDAWVFLPPGLILFVALIIAVVQPPIPDEAALAVGGSITGLTFSMAGLARLARG